MSNYRVGGVDYNDRTIGQLIRTRQLRVGTRVRYQTDMWRVESACGDEVVLVPLHLAPRESGECVVLRAR